MFMIYVIWYMLIQNRSNYFMSIFTSVLSAFFVSELEYCMPQKIISNRDFSTASLVWSFCMVPISHQDQFFSKKVWHSLNTIHVCRKCTKKNMGIKNIKLESVMVKVLLLAAAAVVAAAAAAAAAAANVVIFCNFLLSFIMNTTYCMVNITLFRILQGTC